MRTGGRPQHAQLHGRGSFSKENYRREKQRDHARSPRKKNLCGDRGPISLLDRVADLVEVVLGVLLDDDPIAKEEHTAPKVGIAGTVAPSRTRLGTDVCAVD